MHHRLSRRALLAGGAALSAASLAGARRAAAEAQGPVRIGCLATLSGSQAVYGKPMSLGMQIAQEQINADGGIAGRKLEVLVRDDGGTANQALAIVREWQGQGINLYTGVVATPTALAINPLLDQLGGVLITSAATADKLTHEGFVPHYFRVTDNAFMRYRSTARVIAERNPEVDTWTAILADTELAHAAWAEFSAGMRTYFPEMHKKQVTLLEPLVVKLGAGDFKNQLAQVASGPATGMLTGIVGDGEINLYQQARAFGLFNRIKVTTDTGMEFMLPKGLGRNTPPNHWGSYHWYFGLYQDVPMARRLYDDYVARTQDSYPSGFVGVAHAAVHAYAAGIAHAGTTEAGKLVAALESIEFDSVKGRIRFRREDHQAIVDTNMVRVDPDESVQGWKVTEAVRTAGALVIEPAAPGVAIAM